MTTPSTASTGATPLGYHAFDALFGSWRGRHRKLRDVTDPNCDEWVEFNATHETTPVLAGTGHLDTMRVSGGQAVPGFEALTLRLHDPATDLWRIWWLSTRAPGVMDPPVVGHANQAGGVFECDDVVGGRPVRVRFTWDWSDPAAPTYRQAFAEPDGQDWRTNWETFFTRANSDASA
jgi:hypothetical protein